MLHTVVTVENIIKYQSVSSNNNKNASFQGGDEEQQVCTVFQFFECSCLRGNLQVNDSANL